MREILSALWGPVLLGQFDANPDTPTSILAAVIALGTVIVGGLLFALRAIWKEGELKDLQLSAIQKEFSEQLHDQLRESLRVTIDATQRNNEAVHAIEAATAAINQFRGQQFSPEVLASIDFHLRALRERGST